MNPPRHDIREHVDAIISIASRLDPDGVDAAIADIPGAWVIASLTGQRNGYGYHCILEHPTSGTQPVFGFGRNIPAAIRAAGDAVRITYPS